MKVTLLSTFLMDSVGLFCLYLRYFPSYQLRLLIIWKLRIWGNWKYVILREKNSPRLSISRNENSDRNPVLACSHRKIKKYGSKWKFMILKILFLKSPIFSNMIVFLVWENWPEKNDFKAQTILFVPSFSTFLMDDLGLFCLYLRYFPSYQLHSLSIWKLRFWGFWKYITLVEKY